MPKYVKPAIVTLTSTASSGSTSGETRSCGTQVLLGLDPISFHGLMDWKGYWHEQRPCMPSKTSYIFNMRCFYDVHPSEWCSDSRHHWSPSVVQVSKTVVAVERIWKGQNLTEWGVMEWPASSMFVALNLDKLIMAYIWVFHVTAQLVHVFDAEIL